MHVFFAHKHNHIFLIEITINKCFISYNYNNPLNYSLKYGITGEFRNFWTKVSFIAENPHLIESNDRESWLIINRKYSGCAVTDFWKFCAVGSSGKFERSSVASQTGLPGKGGVPGTGGEKVDVFETFMRKQKNLSMM
jgi:hypothetical protein